MRVFDIEVEREISSSTNPSIYLFIHSFIICMNFSKRNRERQLILIFNMDYKSLTSEKHMVAAASLLELSLIYLDPHQQMVFAQL